VSPDFSAKTLFPSTLALHDFYKAGQPFFTELSFTV
jgi:hypothetical protein